MSDPRADEGLRDALRACLTRRGLDMRVQERGTVKATASTLAFVEVVMAMGRPMWRAWAYGSGQWYYDIDQLQLAVDFVVEELGHIEARARRALGKGKA